MATASSISYDNLSVLSGGTVRRVQATSATSGTSSSSRQTSTAGSSDSATSATASSVTKASDNAGKALDALTSLRNDLAAATKTELTQADTDRLNARIAEVRDQVNALSKGTGSANLLSSSGSVTVTSAAGDKIAISGQKLDSASLGLDDLSITDAQSLRQAAGRAALATGQAQRVDYNLSVAQSVITPTKSNPGLDAYSQISTAAATTPKTGTVQASVEQAVSAQASANASYANAASGKTTRTRSILDLFG